MNTSSTSLPYTKVNLSLTFEAIDFLSETTNGTSHFAILGQLIKNTSVTPSSTSKRGNLITLGVGQVECSIHSCCAHFGIGRKKFEAIMRKMEQHGIIRMHRSRLATVADLTCKPHGSYLMAAPCLTALMAIRQTILPMDNQKTTMPRPMTAAMSMMEVRMPLPSSAVRVFQTQAILQLQSHPSLPWVSLALQTTP